MKSLTIGGAAEAAGVGVETIRFYERRGLIDQPRKPVRSGFRTYPDDVVPRLRFIRRAQAMGFSLDEIADLLSLRADPSADCGIVRERAAAKLAEVDRKLGELDRMRAALEDVIAACPARGALRQCTILEALEGAAQEGNPARQVARGPGTRRKAGMKSITLKVEGMHCDGCAQTIEALVGAEEGVKAIAVTYKTGEARILFDPLRTSEAKLIAVIKRPGFRVADAPLS
jgi:Hg(II)-responsive transcriptional regulator